MRNLVLPILAFIVVGFVSCEGEIAETKDVEVEKEMYIDSISVAEVVTEDFDTTGVPLYYVPKEFTENSEKKIFSSYNKDVGVTVVKYCQTKEGGIEVNYQLESGAKFRIHYRDWAGRILVSKGDSIVNNYSFGKQDYSHLKDDGFWNDKILQNLWLLDFDSDTESVSAMFSVSSPSDEEKAEFEGITIQIKLDSSGVVELTEIP